MTFVSNICHQSLHLVCWPVGRSVTYCCMRYKSKLFGSILLSCLRCLVLFNVHCRNCYLRMAVNCCDTWSWFGKVFCLVSAKMLVVKCVCAMRIVCVRFLIFISFTATTQGERMKKRKTKTADSGTRSIWFWCISAVIFLIVIVLLSDLCGRVHLVWPKLSLVCVCVYLYADLLCWWVSQRERNRAGIKR